MPVPPGLSAATIRRKVMQRQTWALTGALCAGLFLFNSPIAAQSSMESQSSMDLTDAQVTAKLQAAGYSNVRDVEHEGDHYDADAMKNGRKVHVHVDARSGAITPANGEKDNEEHEEHEHHPC
jgi:predicted aspartyl protease